MEDGITARNLPHDLSQYVTKYFEEKGVKVYPGSSIVRVQKKKEKTSLVFKNTQTLKRKFVSPASCGWLGNSSPIPNWLSACGLKVENGILVNEYFANR